MTSSEGATFTLKPEHITLLRHAYVQWQDCETGAPEIDPKRPYGNSSVALDVAEILGEKAPDEDEDGARAWREWEEKREPELMQLHRETETALQIILATGAFEPGEYRLTEKYDDRSWVRVGGAE